MQETAIIRDKGSRVIAMGGFEWPGIIYFHIEGILTGSVEFSPCGGIGTQTADEIKK